MMILLFLALLWFFFAPFFILGKIGVTEERLNQRLDDLKNRLEALDRDRVPRTYANGTADLPPEKPTYDAAPLASAEEPFSGTAAADLFDVPPAPPASAETEDLPAAVSFEEPGAATPQEPGVVSATLRKLYSWLLAEGNIWVCAGVLLFFVGFGLLFSYAIQFHRIQRFLTLEMRLAAAALTGLAMTGFGFRMRERRRTYALILQGGGMGVLYLVVLAATKFNALSTGLPVLPPVAATAAMLALSVFTVLLALTQDFQPLAIFAILGGFVAPILVSTGSRNHVALFSIYSLLNLAVLLISFKRNWRILNRMGLSLTVGIGAAWGFRDWRPELFETVEPFLLIFLATYTLVSLSVARKIENAQKYNPDLLLAIAPPFSFFVLQTQVVGHFAYGMALTCLGLGVWHLAFGAWLLRRGAAYHRMLPRLFVAFALLFSNLVVPYSFEQAASSAIWAVEGAFLTVVACRYGSYKALLGGILLYLGAFGLYSPEWPRLDWDHASVLSPIFVSGFLFAVSHWVGGFWTARFRPSSDGPFYDDWEKGLQSFLGFDGSWVRSALSWIFTAAGSFWWWWTIFDQIPRLGLPWLSAFSVACATAFAGVWMSVRFEWKAARFLLAGPLAAALLRAGWYEFADFFQIQFSGRYFSLKVWADTLAYLAFLGGSFCMLRKTAATLLSKYVVFAALLAGFVLAARTVSQLGTAFGPDWANLLEIVPLLTALLLLFKSSGKASVAVADYEKSLAVASGAFLALRLPAFAASFAWKGTAVYGLFVPLLNPLELWQAAMVVSLGLWLRLFAKSAWAAKALRWELPALLFVWLNQVAARGTWWRLDEPYHSIWQVLRTPYYQGVIAILWGVLGLGAVMYGQKTRNRTLWRLGAGLLAVDMLKLLLVDLNRTATLARILAFLLLGGLFLLIGWAAPLPPKEIKEDGGYANKLEDKNEETKNDLP